ncbi:MAG: hypothetical protein GKR87_01940 [Kiritimatiellae bacterium]|nr:hypothetical protein [Kiritimatiellia bacterium]
MKPLSNDQLTTFFKNTRDPRRFWITVYSSPEGPVFSGANRLHPNQRVTIPFIKSTSESIPLVNVRALGSATYTALIDTSSSDSWVDFLTAQSLNVIPLGPPAYERYPRHVKDPFTGYLTVLSTLKLNVLHIESALFSMRTTTGSLGPLSRSV